MAIGVGSLGLAPIVGRPVWAGVTAFLLCVAAAAGRVAYGRRDTQRAALVDRLVEAISPVLGSKQPDRRLVRVTRWARGWPGHPTRVQLRYAPGLDDSDPGWRAEVLATVNRRLLETYRLDRHDRRRCRLHLSWAPADETQSTPATQARAERTVSELLGPTARVTEVEWSKDGTELVAIEVRHEAGAKLAAASNRTRIERVVSTMLPGRWRARWELVDDRVRFEVRPPLPKELPHPAPTVDDKSRFHLPIAVGEDGEVISWHLRGAAPHAIVVGKTGQGKSLAIATKVPTPSGWTTMGELKDGDIVFDETGQPCTVVKAHEIRHDRPCFEVKFSDGSTIIADAEHLWWTETRSDRVSVSNKRHKDRYRPSPRARRMTGEQLTALQRLLGESRVGESIALPELAAYVGMSKSHPVLHEIAADLEPVGIRPARTLAYTYRKQTVRQRQDVLVFDRSFALKQLAARARAGSVRWNTTATELEELASRASAGDKLTVSDAVALLGCTRDTARRHLQRSGAASRTESQVVKLLVPGRTVRRSEAGPPTPTYDTAAFASALCAWGLGLRHDRHRVRPTGGVRTTAEIAATLRTPSGHANHSVPVAGAVEYPSADQSIPAYVLGVWLGDGSIWSTVVTSADPEIATQIELAGVDVTDCGRPNCKPSTYKARTYTLLGVRRHLDALGLLRGSDPVRRARTKRIPDCYLIASEQQRRDLLAGLLDTDGTVNRSGGVQFDNTNHMLATQVHQLACSLGYRASIREGRARLNGVDCGPKWTVEFTTADEVFRLERKRQVHKERSARANPVKTRSRYIVDVQPVASVPVRCITVDSPNRLYLVGDTFIPTHNTVVINGIVMEACYRGWPVWICDPKRVEFMGLRSWPNVQIVATSVEDQIAVIYHAWEEMEKRYALIESGHADEGDFEPLILVLDEYRDFYGAAIEWYAGVKSRGMPAKPPVFEKVSSLARKGRTARIHLILGTQRPDAEFLGGEMRDNFATRISLGRLSPQGAMMMWEAAYIGVAVPRGIPGRGTAVTEDDRPVEVQAYWTPDPRRLRPEQHANRQILRQLLPAERTHPALQVQMPEELLHPDEGEPRMWEAVRAASLVPTLEQPGDPLEMIEAPRLLGPAQLLARTTAPDRAAPAQAAEPVHAPGQLDVDGAGDVDVDGAGEDYGDLVDASTSSLRAGDLILVDETTEQWAVIEADPEPDLDDPNLLCIDWRADDDSAGTISVPDDSVISARRPAEEINDLEETS